jgi:hypothetical protein
VQAFLDFAATALGKLRVIRPMERKSER